MGVMTTVALILAVWGVLASLVCAFVAGASRRTEVVPADAPLPVWLELFDREGTREPTPEALVADVDVPAAQPAPASAPARV